MRSLLTIITISFASFFCVAGCRPASDAPGAPSVGEVGIVVGAEIVKATDSACAGISDAFLAAGRKDDAATIASKCTTALKAARASLMGAASALDAGKAWESGDVACSIVNGVDSALSLHPLLEAAGVKIPDKITKLVQFIDLFTGACKTRK